MMRAAIKVLVSIVLPLPFSWSVSAQVGDNSVNDVKSKIIEAQSVQNRFAANLKHCNELDGTAFYLQVRDRVPKLDDYHRALQNLVLGRSFNPDTKKAVGSARY